MEIKLSHKERTRIINGNSNDDIFIGVESIENDHPDYYNKCLRIETYEMHQVFVVRKEGFINVFVFRKDDHVTRADFGYWEDGEIIFTNSDKKL